MVLVVSSQSNIAFKFFSSKFYRIRARPLDSLGQILRPFTNFTHVNPFSFLSSPLFLRTTKVHMFPLSKYNGQELKNELAWWLSWRARARVIGPSGEDVAAAGVRWWCGCIVGIDILISLWAMRQKDKEIPHLGSTYFKNIEIIAK